MYSERLTNALIAKYHNDRNKNHFTQEVLDFCIDWLNYDDLVKFIKITMLGEN